MIDFPRRLVLPSPADEDAEWSVKQAASIEEYPTTHDAPDEYTTSLFRAFRAYIESALADRRPGTFRILDVGCGGYREPPAYAPHLERVEYVGLDPMDNGVHRGYAFIYGRIEDLPSAIEPAFHGFIFSTSLDHARDISAAAAAVRAVAKHPAIGAFMGGPHDPETVAALHGQRTTAASSDRSGTCRSFANWWGPASFGCPGNSSGSGDASSN